MINLLLALHLWGTQWQHKRILLKCDNMAVVDVLNTGRSRDSHLCAIARNILITCANLDIEAKFVHIPGKKNVVADVLSRWRGSVDQFNKLKSVIQNPIWCQINPELFHIDYNI